MTPVDAIAMMEHYFAAKMDQCKKEQLTKAFDEMGALVTPAEMERNILESATMQDVVHTIGKAQRRRCCSDSK